MLRLYQHPCSDGAGDCLGLSSNFRVAMATYTQPLTAIWVQGCCQHVLSAVTTTNIFSGPFPHLPGALPVHPSSLEGSEIFAQKKLYPGILTT